MSQLSAVHLPGKGKQDVISSSLELLMGRQLSPLDLLPHADLREKLVELVLYGEPPGLDAETSAQFQHLRTALEGKAVEGVRIVVFGGGTGLSNLIGGDSRSATWIRKPFVGLKELFPHTRAIVCVTDDGGSTGELQKDLPLIALGDLRHVLLSSVQSGRLQALYGLTSTQAMEVVRALSALFNYRFSQRPDSAAELVAQAGVNLGGLPAPMGKALADLIELLFADSRLELILARPHCLGNLILAAAIYAEIPQSITHDDLAANHELLAVPLARGLGALTIILGAAEQAVLPCTSAQAQLSVLYSNGVEVIGEYKSGYAQRGYPVERVFVNFCDKPHVYPEVLNAIAQADILVMAPGSLYSSLIPIFQVPGLAQAVRDNVLALKILVSNLWVQAGETDRSMGDAERKFHVSDLLRAYDRNIPGGTRGLFDQVLCLSLKDVPASVLQNYAVEGKVPIYLDRAQVRAQGFTPIECGIFSKTALAEQGFIQHGPIHLAKVIKTLWAVFDQSRTSLATSRHNLSNVGSPVDEPVWDCRKRAVRPSSRYQQIEQRLMGLSIELPSPRAGKTKHESNTCPPAPPPQPSPAGGGSHFLPSQLGGESHFLPSQLGGESHFLPSQLGGESHFLPSQLRGENHFAPPPSGGRLGGGCNFNTLQRLSYKNCGCRQAQDFADTIRRMMKDILWRHPDIPLAHLAYVRGVACVEQELWLRSQKWDSVFSFYDPADGLIKIREDQFEQEQTFEVAFLVALGQSLLGNYASHKEMKSLQVDGVCLGKVYHLYLQPEDVRSCWFSDQELRRYLELARMRPTGMDALVSPEPGKAEGRPTGMDDPAHFTRLINGDEGFTPPGMLMGLNYAWYLDNRFASHVEYKMAVMKIAPANLIPEQVKMLGRRQRLVSFFREVVFRKEAVT